MAEQKPMPIASANKPATKPYFFTKDRHCIVCNFQFHRSINNRKGLFSEVIHVIKCYVYNVICVCDTNHKEPLPTFYYVLYLPNRYVLAKLK